MFRRKLRIGSERDNPSLPAPWRTASALRHAVPAARGPSRPTRLPAEPSGRGVTRGSCFSGSREPPDQLGRRLESSRSGVESSWSIPRARETPPPQVAKRRAGEDRLAREASETGGGGGHEWNRREATRSDDIVNVERESGWDAPRDEPPENASESARAAIRSSRSADSAVVRTRA
jgi:hypothetical protein